MKKFSVHLDVTLSGYVEVEANSEEEARKIIEARTYQHYDCRDFYYLSKDIVDIEEVDSSENVDYFNELSEEHIMSLCAKDLGVINYCYNCGLEIEEGRSRQDKDGHILCEDCFAYIQQQSKDLGLAK